MTVNNKRMRSFLRGIATILSATFILTGVAMAAEKSDPPQTTPEGLKLTTNEEHRLVYRADDVDFSVYKKVMIVDCAVAFAKNWQRDYNRSTRDLSRQVKDKDVERMKEGLAAEFKKVFTEVLTENGVEVVTEPAADVLVLRPALINVVANSPDIPSAGMVRTYTADAGQMTLYLEIYDSVSSALLAEAMDAQADRQVGATVTYSNKITNVRAVDRILKGWANEIAGHFNALNEPAGDD
jgi:hypothetical protein